MDIINLELIPKICDLALSIDTIGPIKILKRNVLNKVILNRKQIGILLACQFFCIFKTFDYENCSEHLVGDFGPTGPLNFMYWLLYKTNITESYLKTLFYYFEDYFNNKINFSEKLIFQRNCLKDFNL